MKKSLLLIIAVVTVSLAHGQDYTSRVSEARKAYSAGKLDDARFAMQQAMQEIDILIGKDILKLLPQTLVDQPANTASDNVTTASGFVGVIVHRDYGKVPDGAKLEIITNSPLIATLNSLLSLPFIGNNAEQKKIKVNGYKALLTNHGGTPEKPNFQIQLPLQSSLLMLDAPGKTADQIQKMAAALPIEEIAKLVQ